MEVEAGQVIDFGWTPWPPSHFGPSLAYLAPCANGDCLTVDKADLEFQLIKSTGQIRTGKANNDAGYWASNQLIDNNNKDNFKVPDCVKPGPYVLRVEMIALMGASHPNGAQHYPNCINIMVKGSGTNSLAGGTKGTSLYQADHPGLLVKKGIYGPINYQMPGPKLFTCGVDNTPVSSSTISPVSASSKPAAMSSPAAISSPAASASSLIVRSESSAPAASATPLPYGHAAESSSPAASATPSPYGHPAESSSPAASTTVSPYGYPAGYSSPSASATPINSANATATYAAHQETYPPSPYSKYQSKDDVKEPAKDTYKHQDSYHKEPAKDTYKHQDSYHKEPAKDTYKHQDSYHKEPAKDTYKHQDSYHKEPVKATYKHQDSYHKEPAKDTYKHQDSYHKEPAKDTYKHQDSYHKEPAKDTYKHQDSYHKEPAKAAYVHPESYGKQNPKAKPVSYGKMQHKGTYTASESADHKDTYATPKSYNKEQPKHAHAIYNPTTDLVPKDATKSQLLAWKKICDFVKGKLASKQYRKHAREVIAA